MGCKFRLGNSSLSGLQTGISGVQKGSWAFVSRVYVLEKDKRHFKLLRMVTQTNTNSAEEELREPELSHRAVGMCNDAAITDNIMAVIQNDQD